MTKITFKQYLEMMHEAEEKYGAVFEQEISERDWNNPLIKDERNARSYFNLGQRTKRMVCVRSPQPNGTLK